MPNIVVTGASSGIGLALCEALVRRGDTVVGVARSACEAPAGASAESGLYHHIRADLSVLDGVDSVMQRIFAVGQVQAAVLCHGFGDFGSLEEFSAQRIGRLVNTNFTSHALIARHLLPHLKRNGSGQLVFIGSEAAIRAGKRGAVYSASKCAIRGFAQALREECASSQVRISVINPGMVDTRFFEALDFAPGEDHANSLQVGDVVQALLLAIDLPANAVVDEIRLSPLKRVIRNRGKL